MYENFTRVLTENVEAGDICAVCGISDIMVSIFRFAFLQISASIVLRNTYGNFMMRSSLFYFSSSADWGDYS